jgi:integrase
MHMSNEPKYAQAFVREVTAKVKSKNGRAKTVHKAWKGVLKYKVENPDYVERPSEGDDTRSANQKRREVWRQVAQTFDSETVRSKSEALDALAKWKRQMNDQARAKEQAQARVMALVPDPDTYVGDYVHSFIDDLEASESIERRTVRDYRGIANRIAKGFEEVALRDLTAPMIQKWENGLIKSGLSGTTVIKYHRLLSEACQHAVNVDVLLKNPCQAVKTPKRRYPSPNSLTAEGYARLAATLDSMEPSPLVTAAAIAMHTGMRQGEVSGLRWRNYDSDERIIHVVESIGVAEGGSYSKTPKTKSSMRDVPVSPQLADLLERRRHAMLALLHEGGLEYTKDEFGKLYVVGFVDGRFYDPLRICKEWKALSESFGLMGTQDRPITFHDLRHSFATRAIAAKADVKAVASVLGHTNASITLNVYADADPESKRRASDLVADAIAAQGEVKLYATKAKDE